MLSIICTYVVPVCAILAAVAVHSYWESLLKRALVEAMEEIETIMGKHDIKVQYQRTKNDGDMHSSFIHFTVEKKEKKEEEKDKEDDEETKEVKEEKEKEADNTLNYKTGTASNVVNVSDSNLYGYDKNSASNDLAVSVEEETTHQGMNSHQYQGDHYGRAEVLPHKEEEEHLPGMSSIMATEGENESEEKDEEEYYFPPAP